MKYYDHHLGDYLRDTAHLSMLEDGAYRRLIDLYYMREAPLPTDLKQIHRLVRANGQAERNAVLTVLREFFAEAEDGWHHKRCDEEIAHVQSKSDKARGSANARWKGKRSQSERNANASETHCEGNATQYPIPNTPLIPQKRKAQKTQIPDAFAFDDDLIAYAATKLPDVDPAALAESFRGKALAKGWQYIDWRRAAQEFIRNCAPDSGHFAAGQYPRKPQPNKINPRDWQ